MALHEDRPTASVRASSIASTAHPAVQSPPEEPSSAPMISLPSESAPGAATGIKRTDPTSPRSPSGITAKKPKSASSSGAGTSPLSPSAAASTGGGGGSKKTTSIEILNAERIRSPAPAPAPVPTPAPSAAAASTGERDAVPVTDATGSADLGKPDVVASEAVNPERTGSEGDVEMAEPSKSRSPPAQESEQAATVGEVVMAEKQQPATSAPTTPPLPTSPSHSQAGDAASAAVVPSSDNVTMKEATPPAAENGSGSTRTAVEPLAESPIGEGQTAKSTEQDKAIEEPAPVESAPSTNVAAAPAEVAQPTEDAPATGTVAA